MLSGPNMAEEVAAGLPGATVIATEDAAFGRQLQEALNSGVFRVYLNDDLIGVELCAAAKNVIALAAGACDGLGVGDNAKAALITRGPRRDGPARRGRGRRLRDVLRARRDGRPDRHLLAPDRPEPPRRAS